MPVDGGSLVTVLRHVILPGIITGGAFTFMTAWGAHLMALPLITSGGVMASLPIALMFMFVQRGLVSGPVAGGVKGYVCDRGSGRTDARKG